MRPACVRPSQTIMQRNVTPLEMIVRARMSLPPERTLPVRCRVASAETKPTHHSLLQHWVSVRKGTRAFLTGDIAKMHRHLTSEFSKTSRRPRRGRNIRRSRVLTVAVFGRLSRLLVRSIGAARIVLIVGLLSRFLSL